MLLACNDLLLTQPLCISLVSFLGILSIFKHTLSLLKWTYISFLRPPKDLKKPYGSWALITGSSDGIGRAFAFKLAAHGLDLILVSRRATKLEHVACDIKHKFPNINIKVVAIDFSRDISYVIKEIKSVIKGLDVGVLVNNVGITYSKAMYFHEIDEDTWMKILRVNVGSINGVTKAILPNMLQKRKGAIINIGSGASIVVPSHPLYAIYAATKGKSKKIFILRISVGNRLFFQEEDPRQRWIRQCLQRHPFLWYTSRDKLNVQGPLQGEAEFISEVKTITHLKHDNIVSLKGYCTFRRERMLVYNFVANKTLEHHLHGNGKDFSWEKRMKTALRLAEVFAFLHERNPAIIHRDIKPSNILFDDEFQPKVGDFGVGRLCSDSRTHLTTIIRGSPGYVDPDYFTSKHLSKKSDVFAFGVVLLELITGRKAISSLEEIGGNKHIIEWVAEVLKESNESSREFKERLMRFWQRDQAQRRFYGEGGLWLSDSPRTVGSQIVNVFSDRESPRTNNESTRNLESHEFYYTASPRHYSAYLNKRSIH